MAGDRKLMIIDEKYLESMKIVQKLVKLGARAAPEEGQSIPVCEQLAETMPATRITK